MPSTSPPAPRLLEQHRLALRTRHYSPRTVDAYATWVRRFVVFAGRRHPRELGPEDVRRFLSALAIEGGVSASTQNQPLRRAVISANASQVFGQNVDAHSSSPGVRRPTAGQT